MTVTRRAAIIGPTAVTAFAMLGSSVSAEDEPVLRLARQWLDIEARYLDLCRRYSGQPEQDEALDAQVDRLVDQQHALYEQIVVMPARSWKGMMAKLRIAAVYIGTGTSADRELMHEQRLALSALDDAERLLAPGASP